MVVAMPAHDFTTPIPASTFRISVQWGDDRLFITDIPSADVAETVTAFEGFVGPALALGHNRHSPHAATGCCAVAGVAAAADFGGTVTAAAVWLWLFEPGADRRRNAECLGDIIDRGGSALLIAMTDTLGVEWRFEFYTMPDWPVIAVETSAKGRRRS
jgi:hypothetical protein